MYICICMCINKVLARSWANKCKILVEKLIVCLIRNKSLKVAGFDPSQLSSSRDYLFPGRKEDLESLKLELKDLC